MSRSAPRRRTRPRFVHLGPGLMAIGLMGTFAGCSDDTPRADPIDLAASRKDAIEGGSTGLPANAPKTRDVSRTQRRSKWKVGRTLNSTNTTSAKAR